MANKFEKDLTVGSVWKQLLWFSLPFFFSNLVQSCFNLADMVILGHFGGTNSMSGVSNGSSVMVLITTLAAGLATGGTVVIGNYMGSGNKHKINKVISTLLITLGAVGLFFMVSLLLGVNKLFSLMNVPAESFAEARKYLTICAIGIIFIFGYNALASIMRGLGDAKTPMIFIIIACIINIILDLILVAFLHLGSVGASLATVVSQALSMIFCIIYLKVNDFMFDFRLSSFKFYKEEFGLIIKTGLPVSIQAVANNFSFLLLNSFNNKLGGVNASAGVAIVFNFNGFAILPCHAINAAATAMISQNMGKGNFKRAKETLKACLVMCICVCTFVFVLVHLFPNQLFGLFGAEEAVIKVGIPYLMAFSFEYVGLPYIVAFNAFQTGTGRGWTIMVTTLFSSYLFRIPIAYILGFVAKIGLMGVSYSIPIATLAGALISLGFFLYFRNKPTNLLKAD